MKEGSLVYVVHEAADEKVHGTCVQDLSSSGGKELNAAESFIKDASPTTYLKVCIGFNHAFLSSGHPIT
jgi:hypothetical protein